MPVSPEGEERGMNQVHEAELRFFAKPRCRLCAGVGFYVVRRVGARIPEACACALMAMSRASPEDRRLGDALAGRPPRGVLG